MLVIKKRTVNPKQYMLGDSTTDENNMEDYNLIDNMSDTPKTIWG